MRQRLEGMRKLKNCGVRALRDAMVDLVMAREAGCTVCMEQITERNCAWVMTGRKR